MPKITLIFEQDGETCVSLGKLEGEGAIVLLTTQEERQAYIRARIDMLNELIESYSDPYYRASISTESVVDTLKQFRKDELTDLAEDTEAGGT